MNCTTEKTMFGTQKIADLKMIRSFSIGTSSGSMLFFSRIVDEMTPPSTLKLPFVGGGGGEGSACGCAFVSRKNSAGIFPVKMRSVESAIQIVIQFSFIQPLVNFLGAYIFNRKKTVENSI